MKPADREELFREAMTVYLSGDLEKTRTYYSDDVEVTAPQWTNAGEFRGHDGFQAWIRQWLEAWEAWEIEPLDVEAVGERHVIARVRVTGTGRGSGIQLDHEAGYVVDVGDDGLIVYLEITMSEESARARAHEREVSN